MNVFEVSTRKKFRFPSTRGSLTVEQLWDLPLTSRDDFDLDTVARSIDSKISTMSAKSFVSTKVDPDREMFEIELEVVKHIIAVKVRDAEAADKAASNAAERKRLLEVLDQKGQEELAKMSKDDILKRLSELS